MADTKAPATFSSLPVEIRLGILADLQPTNLIALRRVCKSLRDTIDQPTNQTSLTARCLSHLEEEADSLVHYEASKPISFINALRTFLKHRGIHSEATEVLRFEELFGFGDLWSRKLLELPQYRHYSYVQFINLRWHTYWTVRAIVDEHVRAHHPSADVRARTKARNFIDFSQEFRKDVFPFPRKEVRTFVNDIYLGINQQGLLLGTPFVSTQTGGYPAWYVTRPYASCRLAEEEKMRRQPFCNLSEIEALLGVPSLCRGSRADKHFYYLSWCSKTEWAYERLKSAMKQGMQLTVMEKAVVLEALYIC